MVKKGVLGGKITGGTTVKDSSELRRRKLKAEEGNHGNK